MRKYFAFQYVSGNDGWERIAPSSFLLSNDGSPGHASELRIHGSLRVFSTREKRVEFITNNPQSAALNPELARLHMPSITNAEFQEFVDERLDAL